MSREASFRGVPFFVETSGTQGGRAGPVHEFIGTDNVFPEDTGPLPKRFSLNGHLIGDDIDDLVVALEEALDAAGPGELIHPYRGSVEAKVDGPYSIDQSTTESGMARLSISFVRTGEPLAPTLDLDTGFDLNTKIDYTLSLVTLDSLDVTGPDFLATAAYAVLVGSTRMTGKLQRANAKVGSAVGIVTDLSSAIDNFSDNLEQLLRSPANLAIAIRGLMNTLFAAISSADESLSRGDKTRDVARTALALSEMTSLSGNDVPPVDTTTTTRQREQDNQDALLDASEISGLCEGFRSLGEIPLDNTDQADSMVADALEVLDTIVDRGSLDDGMDQALRDMRASFIIHIRAQTVELTGLGEYTPAVDMPALAIAWELYGDAGRDQEIVERNHLIEDPGSVHGGVALQVADD